MNINKVETDGEDTKCAILPPHACVCSGACMPTHIHTCIYMQKKKNGIIVFPNLCLQTFFLLVILFSSGPLVKKTFEAVDTDGKFFQSEVDLNK